MFQNDTLKNHLETSSTIKTQAFVVAEWNMNNPENILQIGNYRYRPSDSSSKYYTIPNTYDANDDGNFYTGATNADIVIDGGVTALNETTSVPITFISEKVKEGLFYSLEDCFGRFRPRSGINKARFFLNKYLHHDNIDMAKRPRYYMPDKNDKFKYWSSFRTENSIERGISKYNNNGVYFIDDASPYVVYKESIATNRIVVKMQTNVGTVNLGNLNSISGSIADPLYGNDNKTTPKRWKIQYLKNNVWTDAIAFSDNAIRQNGMPIVKEDGYVELSYGLIIPERYTNNFIHVNEFYNENSLPDVALNGYAYLIKTSETDVGYYKIYFENSWETFVPKYDWYLSEDGSIVPTGYVTNLVEPIQYVDPATGLLRYKEYQEIDGLRIVVDTMNKADITFDLIELSPRLCVDLSDKIESASVTKAASDLGLSGMPVGQLLASTGSIKVFDYDQSFSNNNPNSIIAKYTNKNIQIKIYEVVGDVDGFDYYIPIKTMYSEGFPEISSKSREVNLKLRDQFLHFESMIAPQILVQDASVSYAVSLLLDSIGFSNYVFKRNAGEQDVVIPYFYVGPDKTVAEVLNDLAVSTQTAMFFDEYNNFVMMSKNYIMPTVSERDTDIILYGSSDFAQNGLVKNDKTVTKLANIVDIASENNEVYNDGKIIYSTKYIQKSYGTVRQASLIDKDKTWIYKPVLLWEVAGENKTKSQNDDVSTQSAYSLAAIPLNSNLASTIPTVSNGVVVNNTIDFGEGVYWLSRYNGYFYANGEVIKYDAVQYSVAGNSGSGVVWIANEKEYQNYFSKLSFNGKLYPTGLVRIYSEPNYITTEGITKLQDGAVAKHGRGQFGTTIVEHLAGLNPYWYDNANIRGVTMDTKYIYPSVSANSTTGSTIATVSVTEAAAGKYRDAISGELSTSVAQQTSRNGIIKNFLSSSFNSESDISRMYSVQTGTTQSSALIMNGPSFSMSQSPTTLVSYVYKPLSNKFKHFGTRVRIIGKINESSSSTQSPVGSSNFYSLVGSTPDQTSTIGGSAAGLAMMINPETNNGYYFEIAALTENNVQKYSDIASVNNVVFYKVMKEQGTSDKAPAVAIPLWAGFSSILVDDGLLTGQYRMTGETNPTVYDLAVEYEDIGSIRRFYLYMNNNVVAVVDDNKPLKIYNNMALFVRGSGKAMFENIYAINNNYESNGSFEIDTPLNSVFGSNEVTVNEAFRKYAVSGAIQSTYLSGISASSTPKFNLYFEEFGTIMREASYFNVRYDKAYPALYAKISPTFNKVKGYTVSGFTAGSYGAEFLVFNATDTALNLDNSSGNYLRIQGVTFTQQSNNELSVDDYFAKKGDFSKPEYTSSTTVESPIASKQAFYDIKNSRFTYGKKEFSLNAPYIQSQDDAQDLMQWVISKIMKPRKSVGVEVFGLPILQLGDIVEIDMKTSTFDDVAVAGSRFVVYNIEYNYGVDGPTSTVYLSEVL